MSQEGRKEKQTEERGKERKETKGGRKGRAKKEGEKGKEWGCLLAKEKKVCKK